MVLVSFICMVSCKTSGQTAVDKNEFEGGGGNALGSYHEFEANL
jgi:hypothetical protein